MGNSDRSNEENSIVEMLNNLDIEEKLKAKIKDYYNFVQDKDRDKIEKAILNNNQKAIKSWFSNDLKFGTGGLRGIMDVGFSNINTYTISKAAYVTLNYFKKEEKTQKRSVCISYDTRKNSELFAKITSIIAVENGFEVFYAFKPLPTPFLSYSTIETKSCCGIMITASHNPKEYNGFKVYNYTGSQILSKEANDIMQNYINYSQLEPVNLTLFNKFVDEKKIKYLDEVLISSFIDKITEISFNKNSNQSKKLLKVVYTSLHGTGINIFRFLAQKINFTTYYVDEQIVIDSDFSKIKSLNPENPASFEKAIELAIKNNVDVVIATDPDADRVGFAFLEDGGYFIPSGNEIAIMLFYYICTQVRLKEIEQGFLNKSPFNYYAITTVVTTDLFEIIGRYFGVEIIKTLIGFKYIGDQINKNQNKTFLFAAEESNGFLASNILRDKDSFSTINLMLELVCYLKNQNLSVKKYLNSIYNQFGYYKNDLLNIDLAYDKNIGLNEITLKLMSFLSDNISETICGKKIRKVIDFKDGYENFPKSDLIQYIGENFKITIRPSGTEPKIKIYFQVVTMNDRLSKELLETFKNFFINLTNKGKSQI